MRRIRALKRIMLLIPLPLVLLFCGDPKLRVFTSVSGEEFQLLEKLTREYSSVRPYDVHIVNGDPLKVTEKNLEEFDVVMWDITWRSVFTDPTELDGFLQDLKKLDLGESRDVVRELMPWSVSPLPGDLLGQDEKQYFLPYRINVKLVFGNKRKLADMTTLPDAKEPKQAQGDCPKLADPNARTWGWFADVANESADAYQRKAVAFHGMGPDRALLLYELLRSGGFEDEHLEEWSGDRPFDCDWISTEQQRLDRVKNVVCRLGQSTASQYDYRTISGALVTDQIVLGRNWTFTLGVLHRSGREADFEVFPPLRLDECSRPFTLLGGELLGVRSRSTRKEEAVEFMRFLLSERVQSAVARELSWPTMRVDVLGQLRPWQEPYQEDIRQALNAAAPTPSWWSRQRSENLEKCFDNWFTSNACESSGR